MLPNKYSLPLLQSPDCLYVLWHWLLVDSYQEISVVVYTFSSCALIQGWVGATLMRPVALSCTSFLLVNSEQLLPLVQPEPWWAVQTEGIWLHRRCQSRAHPHSAQVWKNWETRKVRPWPTSRRGMVSWGKSALSTRGMALRSQKAAQIFYALSHVTAKWTPTALSALTVTVCVCVQGDAAIWQNWIHKERPLCDPG